MLGMLAEEAQCVTDISKTFLQGAQCARVNL